MTVQQDAATLCYGLYEYADSPRVGWDYRDDGSGSDGVYWAAVRLNGILWVVLRGSVTGDDWRRDFEALPDPFMHDDLGLIHPGFYRGLTLVRDRVLSLARADERIGITGHSLGAGRAALLTGLMVLSKRVPVRRVCFGEPCSGGSALADIDEAVATDTYRAVGTGYPQDEFQHDLVTDVPGWLSHPVPLTDEVVHPAIDDPWGLFKYHHMAGYAKAVGTQQTWQY